MEHLIRLMYSNSFFYAVVFVFALGVIFWLVWVRFFPENDILERFSKFVMGLAVLALFVGGYASVVTKGLDGVACGAGRYSFHLVCYTRDESPLWFWGLVVVLTGFIAILMLAALVFLVSMVAPGGRRRSAGVRDQFSSMRAGNERPVPGRVGRLWASEASIGVIVVSTLAWIATSLHQIDGVRGQVAEVLASAAREKAAVETYLQDHDALPEDNSAMGPRVPADMHSQYVSEARIFKGSIMLKFDEAAADEHLGGRYVMLIAVRHGRDVSWHCASPDIADRYLPVSCRIGL
jgi:hypothetical protein